jgi:hypothetical protein
MSWRTHGLFFLLAVAILSGCGGSVSSAARSDANPSDFASTFVGPIQITQTSSGQKYSSEATLTLAQTGDRVTGGWVTTSGSSGTISGVAKGRTLSALQAKQTSPCGGEYRGEAALDTEGVRLSGAVAGTNCEGKMETISFVLRRQ